MGYQRDENGNLVLGDNGDPVPVNDQSGGQSGNDGGGSGEQPRDDQGRFTVNEQGQIIGPDGNVYDPERQQRTIDNLRNESKSYKSQLQQYEDQGKTEAQKTADEITNLKNQLAEAQQGNVNRDVRDAAKEAGMLDPSLAHRLVDLEENTSPQDAVASLKKNSPALFQSQEDPQPDPADGKPAKDADTGGGTNPNRGYSGPMTREKIQAMSYEEQNQNMDAIQEFFRNGG